MTITSKDIYNLIHQGESTSVEMKKCSDSVPRSVWETYSAFANTRGRVTDEDSTVISIVNVNCNSTVNSINDIISSLPPNLTKGRENGRKWRYKANIQQYIFYLKKVV